MKPTEGIHPQSNERSTISQRLRAIYDRKVVERSFLGQLLRRVRRAWLGTFHADYVKKSVAENRMGECHRCGLCCQLIYKCPFLGRDSQNLPYCRVYGELRPTNCRSYPIDAIDSEVDRCGFKFPEKTTTKQP